MKSSDAYPEPNEAKDGSLEASSSATGSPTASDDLVEPDAQPSPADPDSLIEHGRVATAEDME